jgi:hypothetical protein
MARHVWSRRIVASGVLVEHEQPTRRSLGERGLGDQFGWQVVGEVMALHARMVLQSRFARRLSEWAESAGSVGRRRDGDESPVGRDYAVELPHHLQGSPLAELVVGPRRGRNDELRRRAGERSQMQRAIKARR